MGYQHDRSVGRKRRLDRWQGGPDASIARHHPVSDGDVQVFTNKNAFARQVNVGHLDDGHAVSLCCTSY